MKRILFFLIAITFSFGIVFAQNKKTKTKPKPNPVKRQTTFKPMPVYLGFSEWRNGTIGKKLFDSLAMQGLTAKDSGGVVGKVVEFRLYYKERNLYEDSVGNYYFGTDLMTDFSSGNMLNNYMGSSLSDRTKNGDTAIFEDIIVLRPDSSIVRGLPMVFRIGK